MGRGLVAVVVLAANAAGCEVDPTEIVVVIQTDMDVPAELDGVGTRVGAAGRAPNDERRFSLRAEAASEDAPWARLPASFGVAPRGGDPERRVEVVAEARRGDAVLFTTRAITSFVEHRILRLDLYLAERCIDEHVRCDPEDTCTIDGCVPAEIDDPGDLPDFEGLDAGAPDAGDGDGGGPSRPVAGLVFEATDPLTDVALRAGAQDLYVAASLDHPAHVVGGDDLAPLGAMDLVLGRWSQSLEFEQGAQIGAPGATVAMLAFELDTEEGLVVGGSYGGAPDLGGGPLPPSPRASASAFVARFTGTDLALDWAWTAGSTDEILLQAVAPGPGGQVAIGGRFRGGVDLGEAELSDALAGFVAILGGPDHAVLCHVALAEAVDSEVTGLAFDPEGLLLAAGTFGGQVDLGDGVTRRPQAGNLNGGFVVRYRDDCTVEGVAIATGELLTATAVPGADGTSVVAIGGAFSEVTIAPETVPFSDIEDVWSVALDETLAPTGSASLASFALDHPTDVAARAGVPVVVGGFVGDDASFGDFELPTAGGDGFVAALDDTGQPTWAEALGGTGEEAVTGVSWHPIEPRLYVVGWIDGAATLHDTPLEPALGSGAYVLGFPLPE